MAWVVRCSTRQSPWHWHVWRCSSTSRMQACFRFDYMYCEVRFSRDMLLPWYSKPEGTKALIESPVLSREYGDLFLGRGEPGKGYSALPSLLIGPEPEPRGIPQKRRQSPVHKVPSVVILREWNYLINTNHPRFEELMWSEPRAFVFDLPFDLAG